MAKRKKKNSIPRRMFLKGTGGVTLGIPFLVSVLPNELRAQTTPIRRYVNFSGSFEYAHHMHWFPTLDALTSSATPSNGDLSYRYQALSSFLNTGSSSLSRVLGSGLNPFISKMNIYRGLNLPNYFGHGYGHTMGNLRGTEFSTLPEEDHPYMSVLKSIPTIDQVLANNRNFTPHSLDPLSWGLGFSYEPVPGSEAVRIGQNWEKPHEMFRRLFYRNGSWVPEAGGTTQAHPRRDILSRVLEDFTRVRNGRRISSNDKVILDNAMDQISDLQSRLGESSTGSGCFYSNIDTSRTENDGMNGAAYSLPTHQYAFELYARIYAAAATCDLHRVFNFHINLDLAAYDRHPSADFHQGHSHEPFSTVANQINHQYMADLWSRQVNSFLIPLLQAMDAVDEGNGNTLLDNSIVHMTTEASTVHSNFSVPCLTIGSAGGNLKTGYMLDYSDRNKVIDTDDYGFSGNPNDGVRFRGDYEGAHYNRSLVTILQALGLSRGDYEDSTINRAFVNRTDGLFGAQNNNIGTIGGYGHVGPSQLANNTDLYRRYSHHNLNFFKNALPMPGRNA